MVNEQIAARGISSPLVLDAMRAVPRHEFVPPALRERAYADTPLPIAFGQTISQPYIVGLMTALLDVRPGDRVFYATTLGWMIEAMIMMVNRKGIEPQISMKRWTRMSNQPP